jgi:hypothetical protein
MTTNAQPNEHTAPNDEAARRAAEFRRFAATWHPLDRVPFPTLPTQPASEPSQTERSTNRVSGYF